MKRTAVISILLALALVLTGTLAEARKDGKKFHDSCTGSEGMMLKDLFKRLDLSESQKQEIEPILKQHRQEAHALRTDLIEARKQLIQAATDSSFNEAAVREASRQVARFQEELAVLRAKTFHDIKPVLTPEQQETVQQWKTDKIKKMEGRIQARESHLNRQTDTQVQE